MADARVRIELSIQIYAWQWAVLEMMYDPATINRLRAMCGPRQLTRHAYPGQPAKRTTAPVRPCSCTYAPAVTEVQYGTYDYVWRFTINPRCPHHGDVARFCCPHHQ